MYNNEGSMIERKGCQNQCLPYLSEGKAKLSDESIKTRVQLILKRHLSSRNKRKLKRYFNPFLHLFRGQAERGRQTIHPADPGSSVTPSTVTTVRPKQGDKVRVKAREEIQATLDQWNELKGCQFMDAMAEYCGTTQGVFRRVEKFVDERDYRVKKASGVVLLEGIVCNGTAKYGRCDRACYYFWRDEWLEKVG